MVTVLTNLHDDSTISKQRRTSSATGGGVEEIIKPLAVERYNTFMGGVDKLDQFLSYYGFTRRTLKWWRKAFFALLDIAIVNGYILYTLADHTKKKLTHMQFRIELAKQLLLEVCHTLPSSSNTSVFSHSPWSSLPPTSRLTERHFLGKVPIRINGKSGQRDCAVCSKKKGRCRKTTTYFCKQCGVGLCAVPCFELYHTKVDPVRYLTNSLL